MISLFMTIETSPIDETLFIRGTRSLEYSFLLINFIKSYAPKDYGFEGSKFSNTFAGISSFSMASNNVKISSSVKLDPSLTNSSIIPSPSVSIPIP